MVSSVGTQLWQAPEARSGRGRYDERCDIFSYAVFLLELAEFETVHGELVHDAELLSPDFVTPDLGWLGSSWVVPFVSDNWCADPARRTPFAELSAKLDALAGLQPQPTPAAALCSTGIFPT